MAKTSEPIEEPWTRRRSHAHGNAHAPNPDFNDTDDDVDEHKKKYVQRKRSCDEACEELLHRCFLRIYVEFLLVPTIDLRQ
jgi:hypothetical protein